MTDADASRAALLDAALAEPPRPKRGPLCWFEDLDPDLQAVLNRHFDRRLTNGQISNALAPLIGRKIAEQTIGRHRNGNCQCQPRS